MNFKPELVELILTGRKTQTRRVVSDNPRSPWYRERCALKVNHAYAVCPGRGKAAVAKVLIVNRPWRQRVDQITDGDAVAEGFISRTDFEDYWRRLHGSYDPDTEVWRVEFALIPQDDYVLWEGAA